MKLLNSFVIATTLAFASLYAIAQDAKSFANEMLSAAASGNEAKILELKSRIDLLPKPEKGDRKVARGLNDAALKQLNAGDHAGAVATFEKALQADKADVEITNNFGYALIKAKQYQAAERVIFDSIALAPGRSGAWFNLGQVYGEQGNKDKSVVAFDIAYTFSQNKDKTKEFLNKFISDPSASPSLISAATEALSHEGIQPSQQQPNLDKVAQGAVKGLLAQASKELTQQQAPSPVQAPAQQQPEPQTQQPSPAPVPEPPKPVEAAPAPTPAPQTAAPAAPAPQQATTPVSEPPKTSSKGNSNVMMIVVGLLMAAGGGFIIFSYYKKMPTDGQMDEWINEDIHATKQKALGKIGVEESELVHEQIVIVGPRLDSTGGAEIHYKVGADKVVRYTPMNVTILNMTANQLIAYNCALDQTTGNQLQESTDEYFYKDVVSVSTKTSSFTMKFSQAAVLPGGGKIDQMQFNSGEKFILATSGGTSIEVFLKDDQWQQQLGGKIWTLDVEKAVQAVRKMLREKKQ